MSISKRIWDVIIVGGGPAGCTAAIVLARSKRRVLLIDEGKQRNLKSRGMHVYLTRDGISPANYFSIVHNELDEYKVQRLNTRIVKARALADKGFEIVDHGRHKYLCKRLLIATGTTDNIPNVPGMQQLWGQAVFHCPYCDGWESRDGVIGVYAQKHNGFGMAMALRQLSDNIILFTDGKHYLSPLQRQQLQVCKVKVISTRIKQLTYKGRLLKAIELINGDLVDCNTIFVHHGHKVNDELLRQLDCTCTKKGAALVNRKQQTNIPGVYVAGDASYDIHFVVVAAAEGAKAAVAIHNDLLKAANTI
jgi:thioredoxin reductase